jgi:hypothetical protein
LRSTRSNLREPGVDGRALRRRLRLGLCFEVGDLFVELGELGVHVVPVIFADLRELGLSLGRLFIRFRLGLVDLFTRLFGRFGDLFVGLCLGLVRLFLLVTRGVTRDTESQGQGTGNEKC